MSIKQELERYIEAVWGKCECGTEYLDYDLDGDKSIKCPTCCKTIQAEIRKGRMCFNPFMKPTILNDPLP